MAALVGAASDRMRVLVADDQSSISEALRLLLKSEGIQTQAVASPAALLERLATDEFDLILMDLNYARDTTSGGEGLELLHRIRARDRAIPVVVMTAWGSVDLAVEAMQHGANDFIQKPWDNQRLLEVLRTQIARGQALRRQELAREAEDAELTAVHRRLLPEHVPQIQGCRISVAWQPVGRVGGDYFDVLRFSDSQAGLVIADVMGKGLPAALLMSNLQAAVHAYASPEIPPSELCAKVRRLVAPNLADGRFITLFYAFLDLARMRMTFTNAGHNAPLRVGADGTPAWLELGGPVLGEFTDGNYQQAEIELRSGDRLALFTDGIIEARDSAGREFGEQRLAQALGRLPRSGGDALSARLFAEVAAHCAGEFHDDATLVIVTIDQANREE